MADLLRISDLSVELPLPDGSAVRLVESLSLDVQTGQRVALVGESGSGKSLTARSIIGLNPDMRVSGSIRFQGRELVGLGEAGYRAVRGHGIGMVFQDPLSALNPLMRIGDQLLEPLRGTRTSRRAGYDKARRTLEELGVADAGDRLRAYPHQFSGGMRQRVVIAMALMAEPSLLIADEPTTALDVRVQAQVLRLLREVAEARDLGVLFITHDVGVVGEFAHRVEVMYSGNVVERATADDFFQRPEHPYTRGLLSAVPRITSSERLIPMKGSPPSPAARPQGCVFAERCRFVTERCRAERPALRPGATAGSAVACHYAGGAAPEHPPVAGSAPGRSSRLIEKDVA